MSEEEQQESGSGLRAQLEARVEAEKQARAEANVLQAELRQYRFKDAGIDPSTGMGKAIAKTYEGDDLSPDAILEFAKTEYGYEPSGSGQPQRQAEQPQGQSRLDAVGAATLPNDEPSTSQKVAEAQQSGDWMASFALKSERLDQTRAPH